MDNNDEQDRDDEKEAMTNGQYDNQGVQRIVGDAESVSIEENVISLGSPGAGSIDNNDNDDEYGNEQDAMIGHKISVVEMEDAEQINKELGIDPIDDIDALSDGDVVGDINTVGTDE
mmetsp:Transcript_16055/g.14418  ORF Transcript_16055/g.14418 Transcript_16055/m.14418 type:complete len:117 (+) Transcript_16055:3-353(+)